MNTKMFAFGTHILFMCFLQDFASAHLEEPCNLGICVNTFFVPIKNAFCDTDNRCKCQKGFVQVSRHKCGELQEYGGSCESEMQCKATDEHLICDRTRFKPVCECKKSYYYEIQEKKCIPQVKKPKSTPLFPITAVILIACIGIFCGCGIICHNFRRQPELSLSVEQLRRPPPRSSNHNNNAVQARNAANAPNNSNASESLSHPPLLRSESQTSSKYDSLLYDDPPPKYEDAIKDYPTEIVVTSIGDSITTTTANRQPQPLPVKS